MEKVNKPALVKPNKPAQESIEAAAKQILSENGGKEIYATADGNIWSEQNKQFAYDHAFKTNQELITIKA